MSLFAPLLISLFFFSGFVVAGVYAPDCTLANYTWVRMFPFPHNIFWPLTELVAFFSDTQFSRAKCVYSCSVHDFDMPFGL